MQIEVNLSNLQDIYEASRELETEMGMDVCREYVDEVISPTTAQMLLEMCAPICFSRKRLGDCLYRFMSSTE